MNFNIDILRWLTVRALLGRTWAGDRVFDSPSTPADIRTERERDPFIAVYVDESDADMKYVVNDSQYQDPSLLFSGGTATLVIEVGVASAVKFVDGQPQQDPDRPVPAGATVTQLNATDEGLEANIAFITHQVGQTLLSTSQSNPWAELWRMLTGGKIESMVIRRGGPAADARTEAARPRYASRVTVIKTGLLGVPARGEMVTPEKWPFFYKFFATTENDPLMGDLAKIIRAHIEQPTGQMPEWRLAQKYLTVPEDAVRALGIAPVMTPEDAYHQLEDISLRPERMSLHYPGIPDYPDQPVGPLPWDGPFPPQHGSEEALRVEFRNFNGAVQWRYIGDVDYPWLTLYQLEDLGNYVEPDIPDLVTLFENKLI